MLSRPFPVIKVTLAPRLSAARHLLLSTARLFPRFSLVSRSVRSSARPRRVYHCTRARSHSGRVACAFWEVFSPRSSLLLLLLERASIATRRNDREQLESPHASATTSGGKVLIAAIAAKRTKPWKWMSCNWTLKSSVSWGVMRCAVGDFVISHRQSRKWRLFHYFWVCVKP